MRHPHGSVAGGYEQVAEAFAASLADETHTGAALCIYVDGRPVVDLWGGMADAQTAAPWDETTLSVIFSCTKGLVSILAAQLVEAGRLDYDDLVARWWPEFAAGGKSEVRVRHLLSHQAGLSALRVPLGIEDILSWDKVTGLLAAQLPIWPPGSGHAYHPITHGWLVGEVLRRVTGRSVGELLSEQISGPLGADAWIGLPAPLHRRMATMEVGPTLIGTEAKPTDSVEEDWPALASSLGGALPPGLVAPGGGFNDPRLWSAEIPGAGGIASARALARIWSATVCETDGVRLVQDAIVARATHVQSKGAPVFETPPPWPRWGMGFQLDSGARHYLTPQGFGHDGAGGQVAFAEPALRTGFAYLTNRMEGVGDTRGTAIIDALRATLR